MCDGGEFKVCILAAGQGRRMLPLTSNVNKAILPIGNKAVISHIIAQFPEDTNFVIATGYKSDTVKGYVELAHGNRNIEFVEVDSWDGPGSGPGYSLLACEPKLQCPFFFISCDTIFEGSLPVSGENWIGVAKTDNPKEFCTVESDKGNITGLIDKDEAGTNLAFIGLAYISDFENFFNGLKSSNTLVNGELQITAGLRSLITDCKIVLREFSWYDCGSIDGYRNAALTQQTSKFDFSKPDEYIYFCEGKVIKFFADEKVASGRYKRSMVLKGFVPEVTLGQGGFLSYDYVNGNVIYDCDALALASPLFEWLSDHFWEDINLNYDDHNDFIKGCYRFYYDKTLIRLNIFEDIEDDPLFFSANVFGKIIPSVRELLDLVDWNEISNGIPSRFHGDLQFDNILFDEVYGFKLIDWRQDFSGSIEVGDRYYDMAKLLGGMLVSYKQIKQGNFKFHFKNSNIKFSIEDSDNFDQVIKNYNSFLIKNGMDINKVYLITALIYLNMAPLHSYPFSHLLFTMGRVKLYDSLSRKKSNLQ